MTESERERSKEPKELKTETVTWGLQSKLLKQSEKELKQCGLSKKPTDTELLSLFWKKKSVSPSTFSCWDGLFSEVWVLAWTHYSETEFQSLIHKVLLSTPSPLSFSFSFLLRSYYWSRILGSPEAMLRVFVPPSAQQDRKGRKKWMRENKKMEKDTTGQAMLFHWPVQQMQKFERLRGKELSESLTWEDCKAMIVTTNVIGKRMTLEEWQSVLKSESQKQQKLEQQKLDPLERFLDLRLLSRDLFEERKRKTLQEIECWFSTPEPVINC